MSSKRAIFGVVILALLIGAFVFWRSARDAEPTSAASAPGSGGSAVGGRAVPLSGADLATGGNGIATPGTTQSARPRVPRASWASLAADYPIAAKLTAPDATAEQDLFAVDALLAAWRTNFPRAGNPVGENFQITAALTGDNPLQVALLPPNHPAINEQGELCDRFGTPFRLHQLSGEHMEIRSAGADRKFGTADDALWSPPGAAMP